MGVGRPRARGLLAPPTRDAIPAERRLHCLFPDVFIVVSHPPRKAAAGKTRVMTESARLLSRFFPGCPFHDSVIKVRDRGRCQGDAAMALKRAAKLIKCGASAARRSQREQVLEAAAAKHPIEMDKTHFISARECGKRVLLPPHPHSFLFQSQSVCALGI